MGHLTYNYVDGWIDRLTPSAAAESIVYAILYYDMICATSQHLRRRFHITLYYINNVYNIIYDLIYMLWQAKISDGVEKVLDSLRRGGGRLPLGDKSQPKEVIPWVLYTIYNSLI
jgi:hypothetical protein